MPQAVSRKQYRMMMAILHSKNVNQGGRGRPPKSIAAKYSSPGKDAPESKHNDRGGSWTDEHHKRHSEKSKKDKEDKKKEKSKLHKAYENYVQRSAPYGVGAIVVNPEGCILMGDQEDLGMLATPGGHIDPGETPEMAVIRELKEEAGITGKDPVKLYTSEKDGKVSTAFLFKSWDGEPKSSKELKNLRWVEPQDIKWENVRPCCVDQLKYLLKVHMGKMLKSMIAVENLEKMSHDQSHQFNVSQIDATKLVNNGVFRVLRDATKDMKDEEFRDVVFDTHNIKIRKHVDGTYSGHVTDGHKNIHTFVNKPLSKLAAELMSLFEWYVPADEEDLHLLEEEHLPNDAVHGGIDKLVDEYKRHNLGNIYDEMEAIRSQIRNGVAVDLQQVEARMMKLFDKLQDLIETVSGKHNLLADNAGEDIDEIEKKLKDLQSRIDDLEKKPQAVEAFSSNPANPKRVLEDSYPYLSKPHIEISPSGKIRIMFSGDWQPLEKENLLRDLRAKVISKSSR